ncbi:hypothetical protein [Rudaea sp.]|uniref:hypothetical protein n=1 Tax=Rudaea sp. TaxID=2136325 RepID=UPI002ED21C7A
MSQHLRFRCLLGILALLFHVPLYAGAIVATVNLKSLDDAYAFASSGTPVTQTITLTFDANGSPTGFYALLNSLAVQGVNAADFAIVPGGTCVPSPSMYLGTSPPSSCTVIVRYTPSSSAAENAQLAVNCSTIALIGGFTLNCAASQAGSTGTISLLGSTLAAAVGAPALSPTILTLLATLLIGAGTYFAARRNG